VSQGTADIADDVDPTVAHITAAWCSAPAAGRCRQHRTAVQARRPATIVPTTAEDETTATVVVSKPEVLEGD